MDKIGISIIIPLYNKEKYFRKCLQSIINQSYTNYEIIIIDDGSTDKSIDICREFIKKYDKIRYFYQSNSGQTTARKIGLRYANYNYIVYIDADDWIHSNYLSRISEKLYSENIDIITSGLIYEEKLENWVLYDSIPAGEYRGIDICDRVIYNKIIGNQGITHSMSGKVFKKSILSKAFNMIDDCLVLFEDGIAVFTCISLAEKIKVLDYAGYHYGQYGESFIHKIDKKYINIIKLLQNNYIKIACELGIYERVKHEIYGYISFAYLYIMDNCDKVMPTISIPDYLISEKCDVIIYGAGKRGKQIKEKLNNVDDINVVGWIDKNYRNYDLDLKICGIDLLEKITFKYIIIAIDNFLIQKNVVEKLNKLGIENDKIIILNKSCDFKQGDGQISYKNAIIELEKFSDFEEELNIENMHCDTNL